MQAPAPPLVMPKTYIFMQKGIQLLVVLPEHAWHAIAAQLRVNVADIRCYTRLGAET